MDRDEALKLLAEQLASSLEYEYYTEEAKAASTAQAMIVATGKLWLVKAGNQPKQFWVVPQRKVDHAR